MSVHVIYMKDGAKHMRPVTSRTEYMQLRNAKRQQTIMKQVHSGFPSMKSQLLQMNYSCLPNDDGTLKGSKRTSDTVGMDIDHIPAQQMQTVKERILDKRDELRLLMLERSARGEGYHLVFRRRQELTQEENLRWASRLLDVEYDSGAKDITRVFFTTTAAPDDLLFLDDKVFSLGECKQPEAKADKKPAAASIQAKADKKPTATHPMPTPKAFRGIPYADIIATFWQLTGGEPQEGERNKRLHQLAANLRAICDDKEELLMQLMPRYGLAEDELRAIIHSACKEPTKGSRIMDNIVARLRYSTTSDDDSLDADDDDSLLPDEKILKRLPQGVKESVAAAGTSLMMPVITAICPCIGTLATGVSLDVHGQRKGLNLIAYIAGDFASGKGQIDPVIEAWMSELQAMDKMYQQQEDEWRAKKRAAKNKKEQPEEPKLPVRCLTLNNTVANLAERLANTGGKHAFSFTPEADTVAQKWRNTMSDFSVMLRQSYDGTKYEREARSAEAVNVHIERLLWNVTMCGTPDALYRVVNNYTDGFQSRIALARTPDNTFAPLDDKPSVLTDLQTDRIKQIAHLLPLMQGEVVLPRLEARGRKWVERIRLETMMNDDKVRARQRFRVCVTAQRMTCCLMLCRVCEQLIRQHGLAGAEQQMKQHPDLWREMLVKAQTSSLLAVYDTIADSLMENALHFFRERIENAFQGRDYNCCMSGERSKRGKNDSIFERLDQQFGFEQALQQSIAVKGSGVTRNSVQQMLKNWSKQELIVKTGHNEYRKKIRKGG